MKRTGVVISAIVMLVALALPASGVGPEWPVGPGNPPPHGHLLVLASGQCIELGANQVLPRNAHHSHLHVGQAGDAQERAGNTIYPTLRYANCAAYAAAHP